MSVKSLKVALLYIFICKSTLSHGETNLEYEAISDENTRHALQIKTSQELETDTVLNKVNTQSLKQLKYTQERILDYGEQEVGGFNEYSTPLLQRNINNQMIFQESEIKMSSTIRTSMIQIKTDFEELENSDKLTTETTQINSSLTLKRWQSNQRISNWTKDSAEINEQQGGMYKEISAPIQMQNNLRNQEFEQSNKEDSLQDHYDKFALPVTSKTVQVKSDEQTTTVLMESDPTWMQENSKDLRLKDSANNEILMMKPHRDKQLHNIQTERSIWINIPSKSGGHESFQNQPSPHQAHSKEGHNTRHFKLYASSFSKKSSKSQNKGKKNKARTNVKTSKAKSRRYRHKMTGDFHKLIPEGKDAKSYQLSSDNLNEIVAEELLKSILKNNSEDYARSSPRARVTKDKRSYEPEKSYQERLQNLMHHDETSSNIQSQVNINKSNLHNGLRKFKRKVPHSQRLQKIDDFVESSEEHQNKIFHSARAYDESSSKEHVAHLLNALETRVHDNIDKKDDSNEKIFTHNKKRNSHAVEKSISKLLTNFKDLTDKEETVLSKLRTTNTKTLSQEQKPTFWPRELRYKSENQNKFTKVRKHTNKARLRRTSEEEESLTNERRSRYNSYERRSSRYLNNMNKRYPNIKSGIKVRNENSREMKEKRMNRRTAPLLQRQVLPTQEAHELNEPVFYKEMQELFDGTRALFSNIVTFCKSILIQNDMGMTTGERDEIEKLKNMILSEQMPIEKIALNR